jgi:dTDP-4-dehydrorhamnose reductase
MVATVEGTGRRHIMNVLITGSRGQLGSVLVERYRERGDNVFGYDLPEIDITSSDSVAQSFAVADPDVVINCAAWTAVDAAEEQESAALTVNGEGPRVLAEACAQSGSWLVQVSTDYVFAGDATQPYAEDAPTDPQSAYGRTKLAGEIAVQQVLPEHHYIVRTAWLYGIAGSNFVKTMLNLERERETISVVDDQRGQPTFAGDLADQIIALVDARPAAGIFHGTNTGEVSWFEFTQEIFRRIGADPVRVLPVTTAEFPRPAPRPAYSVLGHQKWSDVGMAPMRDWREALGEALLSLHSN